jgi:hypothetical protein
MLVYSRVAELLGMILGQAAAHADINKISAAIPFLLPEATASLRALHTAVQNQSSSETQDRGFDRFLICLHLVSQHYPAILSGDLVSKAAQALQTMRGRLITRARTLELVLRILGRAVTAATVSIEDILLHLQPHMSGLLRAQFSSTKKSATLQVLALEILQGIGKVRPSFVVSFMEPLRVDYLPRVFAKHASSSCRKLYFQVMIDLWHECSRHAFPAGVGARVGESLLYALTDDEPSIREMVLRHLEQSNLLDDDLMERYIQVSTSILFPSLPYLEQWLQHSALLLLLIAQKAPEYPRDDALFSQGISFDGKQTHYLDMNIDSAWTSASFLVSRRSAQSLLNNSSQAQLAAEDTGPILATIGDDLAYSLTQVPQNAEGGKLVSSFLPDSNLLRVAPTQTDISSFASQFGMVKSGRSSISPVTRHVGLAPVPRIASFTNEEHNSANSNVTGLVARAIFRRETKFASQARTRNARRLGVKLSRSYRTGEVPDIQIAPAAVLAPLISLVQLDQVLAARAFEAFTMLVASNVDDTKHTTLAHTPLKTSFLPVVPSAAPAVQDALETSLTRLISALRNVFSNAAAAVNTSSNLLLVPSGVCTCVRAALQAASCALPKLHKMAPGKTESFLHGLTETIAMLASKASAEPAANQLLEAWLLQVNAFQGLDGFLALEKYSAVQAHSSYPPQHPRMIVSPAPPPTGILDAFQSTSCATSLHALYQNLEHYDVSIPLAQCMGRSCGVVVPSVMDEELHVGVESLTAAITAFSSLAETKTLTGPRNLLDDYRNSALSSLQRWDELEECVTAFARTGEPHPERSPSTKAAELGSLDAREFDLLDNTRKVHYLTALIRRGMVVYESEAGLAPGTHELEVREILAKRMQAGIRNVLAYHNSNSLDPIITSITSKAPGLRLPTLMSSAALLVESLGKARSSCNDGLVLLPRIFSTVPQLAGAARFRLLLELQPLSELYRYLVGLQELSASHRIISAKGADGVLAGFASHISEWQNKRFAVSHVAGSKAELAHVDTVLSVRTLVAGHMKKALTIVQGGSSLPAFIKYFNSALRTSYASAFTAAVDAGEQALAKLRMTSCHNVNFERDQPLSAAQRALALQLGRASVAKLGASTATEASVKRMDGLLVQNVRIARHAADELGKDDFIEHLMNSNVDILEQAPLVGTSAEVMSDICISQYALDHQFLLATAARDLFLHRLSFNTPAPPGDTTLLDSLTAFQAACDGSICFPVARCGDTSITLKHPTAVGVISPGRSLMYQQSAANYEFAIFLDEILRKLQDASKASSSILETAICSGGCKTAEDMAAKFVRAVLMCLATCSGSTTIDASARLNVDLGSFDPLVSVGEPTSVAIRTRQRNASLLLPRVLSLCRSNTHALEELKFGMRLRVGLTKVGASSPRPMPVVPVYSFLPWISQVLASITETMSSDAAESKNYRKHLVNLMMEIGAQYPQAVYYPLRISSATLPGDPMSNSAESTATWAEISKMVGSTILDAFVRALEDLHNPEMKFLDWSKAVRVDLQSHCNVVGSTNASLPSESAARWYQDLMSRCFDEGKLVKPGSYVSKWRSTWRDQVTKALQGGKVINAASLAAAEKPAGGDSPTQPPKNNKIASMSQLSMWLSQFSATSDSFIEIPGQYSKYDGSLAPIVAHHAKLIAVDESIRTMSSIRQPKRIVLHGDNQRSYIFLAKGGEDIRVDQRVQQLFNMANVFIERTMRNSSKLLRTYAVVPMTPYIGLIEWVPNTLPIKMAVEDVANIRMERIASELPTAGKRGSSSCQCASMDGWRERGG